MEWKHALLMACSAVGAVALVYCILRDETATTDLPSGANDGRRDDRKASKSRVITMSKEEILAVLNHWLASVEKMRSHMKTITETLLEKTETFEQVYQSIKAVEPEDTLAKYGLSEAEFDELLNMHRDDPQVKEGLRKIAQIDAKGAGANEISAKKVIEVHAFMLSELDSLVSSVGREKDGYDRNTMSIAAQAIVGANVQKKFSLSAEDIEHAVLTHHIELAKDREFVRISKGMQIRMAQLRQK